MGATAQHWRWAQSTYVLQLGTVSLTVWALIYLFWKEVELLTADEAHMIAWGEKLI